MLDDVVPRIVIRDKRDKALLLAALLELSETQVARIKMGDGEAVSTLGRAADLMNYIFSDPTVNEMNEILNIENL